MRAVLGAVASIAIWAVQPSLASAQVNLTQAPAAYYNLHRLGFAGATCQIHEDWAQTLKDVPPGPGRDNALAVLNQIRFELVIDAAGAGRATMTSAKPSDPKMAEAFQQIDDGMKQAVSGFFDTWQLFVVGSPFPAAGTPVDDQTNGQGRRLRYKDGGSDVTTDVGRGDLITRMHVHSSTFDSTIDPSFVADPDGLLLNGYVADYVEPGGAAKTHLNVALVYQSIGALKLPAQLQLDGAYAGAPFAMRLSLTDCRLNGR